VTLKRLDPYRKEFSLKHVRMEGLNLTLEQYKPIQKRKYVLLEKNLLNEWSSLLKNEKNVEWKDLTLYDKSRDSSHF
jgi:hypothetical protein